MADGAELEPLRAGHAAAVVPAGNERAIHLADEANLAKKKIAGRTITRRVRATTVNTHKTRNHKIVRVVVVVGVKRLAAWFFGPSPTHDENHTIGV